MSAPGQLALEIEAIAALLAKADLPQAESRLAHALKQWPDNIRLHFLHAECFDKRGRKDLARSVLTNSLLLFPHNPWPGIRLVSHFLAEGSLTQAWEVFSSRVWHRAEPDEATLQTLLSRLSAATRDVQQREACLQRLLSGAERDRFVLVKLAILKFRAHDSAAAMRLLDAAAVLGPLPPESAVLQIDLLTLESRFDDAFAVAMAAHARQPDRVDLVRKAVQAAHFSNRTGDLIALLQMALSRWPGDWLLLFRYNRCTLPFAIDRALFERLCRLIEQKQGDERWCFQLAIAGLRHQRTALVFALLDRLSPDGPVAHMAQPLLGALEALPRDAWTNQRNVSNDPNDDVQIVRRADAAATIVVLAGVQGGLGYLPFSHADVLLSRHRVNVVYLRDAENRSFLRGVRSLGQDERSTIAGLNGLLGELGVPAIFMGASLGGVAAARYGALARARAVISFAGPVHLHAHPANEELAVSRTNYRGSMFSAVMGNDERLLDLIARSTATRVYQCFGTDYAPDVATAELLRGLPNVVLEPVAGCADHSVVHHMIANGAFDALLPRVIADAAGC